MHDSKIRCGKCGSARVLRVVYGLPTAETMERAVLGEVLLGGCMVFGHEPEFRCAECGEPFDFPPLARHPEEEIPRKTPGEKPDPPR